jgi:hypothetical protein
MSLFFVDCEANAPCPNLDGKGLTEFGVVEYETRQWFHGRPFEIATDACPVWQEAFIEERGQWYMVFIELEKFLQQFTPPFIFVSDNPAFDFQFINYWFWHTLKRNPFGHSARRIGDFYAGLVGDFRAASKWKKLRVTKHTHNPVDDATGNVEAFERILRGER